MSNEHQAITFLKALGKTEVFVRCWQGKGYPPIEETWTDEDGSERTVGAYKAKSDRGKKGLDGERWTQDQFQRLVLELERQNTPEFKKSKSFPYRQGGWCPYSVIAEGGHRQADIKSCPALFIEFDAPMTKEESLLKLKDFPLPYSILIESRAGWQVYWNLDKPTTPKLWRQLQWRLIEYFESDAGIEDPSRVMRLPGFYHLKQNQDPFLINMVECHSDRRYALEDFDLVLPDVPEWRLRLDRHAKRYEPIEHEGEVFDIRNFSNFLNYYGETRRREWITCQCPVHGGQGHSKDSLHINSKTGAYKCHNGCDPKDIYKEVIRLSGWKRFPDTPSYKSNYNPPSPPKAPFKIENPETGEEIWNLYQDEWEEFKDEVAKISITTTNAVEQEFKIRKACNKHGVSIATGLQLKQQILHPKGEFSFVWMEDFLKEEVEDDEWLIAAHLPAATVVDLCGNGGSGKTTLALDWIKAVASGEQWNGFQVKQGRCLLIQDDEPRNDARKKLDIANYYKLPERTAAISFRWNFSDIEVLRRTIEEQEIILCVIDSLGSVNPGVDRDKPAFADNLHLLVDLANEYRCTFLVIDHTNKSGSQLGTVAVRNTVSELYYFQEPTEEDKRVYELTDKHRILFADKSRAGLKGAKIVLEQNAIDYSWTRNGLLGATEADGSLAEEIVDFLKANPKTHTVGQIRSFLASAHKDVEMELEVLRRTGVINSKWVINNNDRFRVYFVGDPKPYTPPDPIIAPPFVAKSVEFTDEDFEDMEDF